MKSFYSITPSPKIKDSDWWKNGGEAFWKDRLHWKESDAELFGVGCEKISFGVGYRIKKNFILKARKILGWRKSLFKVKAKNTL